MFSCHSTYMYLDPLIWRGVRWTQEDAPVADWTKEIVWIKTDDRIGLDGVVMRPTGSVRRSKLSKRRNSIARRILNQR